MAIPLMRFFAYEYFPDILGHRALFKPNRPRLFSLRNKRLVAVVDMAAIKLIDGVLADIDEALIVRIVSDDQALLLRNWQRDLD